MHGGQEVAPLPLHPNFSAMALHQARPNDILAQSQKLLTDELKLLCQEPAPIPPHFRTIQGLQVLRRLNRAEERALDGLLGLNVGGFTIEFYDATMVRHRETNSSRWDIPAEFLELEPAPFDPKADRVSKTSVTPYPVPFDPATTLDRFPDLNAGDDPGPESTTEAQPLIDFYGGLVLARRLIYARVQGSDRRHLGRPMFNRGRRNTIRWTDGILGPRLGLALGCAGILARRYIPGQRLQPLLASFSDIAG